MVSRATSAHEVASVLKDPLCKLTALSVPMATPPATGQWKTAYNVMPGEWV